MYLALVIVNIISVSLRVQHLKAHSDAFYFGRRFLVDQILTYCNIFVSSIIIFFSSSYCARFVCVLAFYLRFVSFGTGVFMSFPFFPFANTMYVWFDIIAVF